MKKLNIIINLLLLVSGSIYAQKTTPKDRYYIDVAVGGDVVISSPSSGSLAGFLLNPKSRNASATLRYQHFLNKSWGLFASVQFLSTSPYDDDDLPKAVIPDPEKYYEVNRYYEPDRENSGIFLFGGQYRHDTKHFSIRPYVGLGFSTFSTSHYNFDLKGRGTNEVFKSDYGFKKDDMTSFCVSPGINLVWKVSSQIHFFGDINYIHHFSSFDAIHSIEDLYTGKNVKQEKDSGRLASLLSMKVGLSIPIWFNKNRK